MKPNSLSNRARLSLLTSLLATLPLLSGCSPEVGSESWCQKLKETPKVDWSTRDAGAYAEHCIFKRSNTR